MISTAIILAAGRGSRLREITATRSKAMVPIAGVPMIGRVLERLRAAGIARFIIVAAPLDHELRAYVSTDPAVRVVTQTEARGSGDALKVCASHVTSSFLVCACDSLIPVTSLLQIQELYEFTGAAAALGVMEVGGDVSLSSRSVVRMNGDRVLDVIEKPREDERISNVTGLPLYVFSEQIFGELAGLPVSPRGEYELPGVFRSMISKGQEVVGCRVPFREDLTDATDLLALTERYLVPGVRVHESVRIPSSTRLVAPLLIEADVSIGDNCTLGPFVYLERGASVVPGACVDHSVVLRDSSADGCVSGIVRSATPSPL